MSVKNRLKKIEDLVGKNKDSAPLVIIFKDKAEQERKLIEHREKYGERGMVIFLPEKKAIEESITNLTINNTSEQRKAGDNG